LYERQGRRRRRTQQKTKAAAMAAKRSANHAGISNISMYPTRPGPRPAAELGESSPSILQLPNRINPIALVNSHTTYIRKVHQQDTTDITYNTDIELYYGPVNFVAENFRHFVKNIFKKNILSQILCLKKFTIKRKQGKIITIA
jgi:hypothetical protein